MKNGKARSLTIVTAIIGLSLMVVGIMGMAPVGPTVDETVSNPVILGGAALMLIGIVVLLLSPVVYTSTWKKS